MTTSGQYDLLGRLDTPVAVIGADAAIVFANERFRADLCKDGEEPVGTSLVASFSGASREALTLAVGEVLGEGRSPRLSLTDGRRCYVGFFSSVEIAEGEPAAALVLLETHAKEAPLGGLIEQVGEVFGEALQALLFLSERVSGELFDQEQALLERGIRRLEEGLKSLSDLEPAFRSGPPGLGRIDVASIVQRVRERMLSELPAGVGIELLMPTNLPRVRGDAVLLERALMRLLQARAESSLRSRPLTILVRPTGEGALLLSVVDEPDPRLRAPTGRAPEAVEQAMAQMEGRVICVEDAFLGRVTTLHLELAARERSL